MRKLVFALVAAFGLGTFGVAQAGGGCSYGHGVKTTSTPPISSPIETTATTSGTDQTPG